MLCFALILLLAIPLHCYVSTTTIFTSTLAFMLCFYVRFALFYLAMSCFYGVAGESGVYRMVFALGKWVCFLRCVAFLVWILLPMRDARRMIVLVTDT
jgi:hypothetical protein